MPKLCEVIAVVNGKKGDTDRTIKGIYHQLQKGDLFDGLTRTFHPRQDQPEEVERLPAEKKMPQLTMQALIDQACASWGELYDLTLTLDAGNAAAKADIIVDGKTIVKDVPVTTLLFLQKRLEELKTFIEKMPAPDAAEVWKYDGNADMLVSEPRQTARTKKVQRPLVMYHATDKHPAQTQLITEDVVTGEWTQQLFTTRIPAMERNRYLNQVVTLMDAVKMARERANASDISKKRIADDIFSFVFGDAYKKKA